MAIESPEFEAELAHAADTEEIELPVFTEEDRRKLNEIHEWFNNVNNLITELRPVVEELKANPMKAMKGLFF